MQANQKITNIPEFRSVLNEFLAPFQSNPVYTARKPEVTKLIDAAEEHAAVILGVVPDVPVRQASIASLLANTYTLVGVIIGYWQVHGSAA